MNDDWGEYELALMARRGDPEALAELVERTRLRLFGLAYAELRHYEDAQDAVAAALLQVCRHIHELREPARVREWMNSIVRNEARRLRRGGPPPMLSLEEADGEAREDTLSLLRLDIERALRQLPGDQARVSRLFYLADLSIDEIARRTGRPPGTIKSWLHRGRRRLAREMEGYAPMKRREALKLLAATPVLATTLEERAAMTPTPTSEPARWAAVIHTDLEPAVIQKITDALSAGGYSAKILTPTHPAPLVPSLRETEVIVLDEWLGGRPAFEYLMNLRSDPAIRPIPVCVLCSDPADFTSAAYFAAGVNRLINKENPDDLAKLSGAFARHMEGGWQMFTERARQVIFFAQEEAAALGENYVGTEHLLLGLTRVPESAGAKVLVRLGISLESIRDETMRQVVRGQGNLGQDMQLTPRAKTVIDLAFDEARLLRNNYLGVEHLLIGMLAEGDGLAARVLLKLGADLERARQEVWAMQAA
jgi:RNA polymerase sigma factor (sigma-70 family)